MNSPLVGDYNVDNALMAMAIMSTLGAADDRDRGRDGGGLRRCRDALTSSTDGASR